ncbi:MAG TPA: cobyrinic acid a,c-diamide synthase [Rhodocyclaceae bacterium]|nr:cobyrinic acid a,c-diamide synthase [Rhodocyclaceae bacterium]
MFGFLQGFAYGLAVSCVPWFVIGMLNPRLAVPTEPPSRWEVIVRYWFVVPFIVFVVWLTSLWGGFSPTLAGWLAGLGAIAVELPLERRWRRWRAAREARLREAARDAQAARQRAVLEREARESGVLVLDPANPPVEADDIVLALCDAKRRLLEARRPDLATQADRLYTRYAHVLDVLRAKFDERELTFERSQGLVAEVCRGALDTLAAMASLARGVAGIDAAYVRRRLEREAQRLSVDASQALRRRLELVEDTERRLRELAARNEAALTALDDTAVAVARVETGRPQAKVAADQALQDLRRFADKAGLYGRGAG